MRQLSAGVDAAQRVDAAKQVHWIHRPLLDLFGLRIGRSDDVAAFESATRDERGENVAVMIAAAIPRWLPIHLGRAAKLAAAPNRSPMYSRPASGLGSHVSMCDIPPQRKIWMTDLALALTGTSLLAGSPDLALGTPASALCILHSALCAPSNSPAVLNKLTRRASRRVIGKLNCMPINSERCDSLLE